jgi:hypothetical protein
MGTKNNPGKFDCYGKALPDEPVFIILARDPSAASTVEFWATLRERLIDRGLKPESDRAAVAKARQCADAMRLWRMERLSSGEVVVDRPAEAACK